MPVIRCVTGSETFREGSGSFIVTVEPTSLFPMPDNKGKYISEAAKAGNHVSAPSRPAWIPASSTGVKEQGSYWDGSYHVPEGAILRVYGRRRIRTVTGRTLTEEGVVYLRARQEGALQRLEFTRIESGQSTRAPVIVEGRFDVLSIREAAAAKVPIQSHDLTLSRPDNVRSVMGNTVVVPAVRAAAKAKIEKVRTHDGGEVTVVSSRTKRAIKL